MMQEQLKNNSDQRSSTSTNDLSLLPKPQIKEPNLKSSLKALMYKSAKLQSRNYCSNLCQIVTPIICLLFTIFVRLMVEGLTTGKVNSFSFPQPFNMPVINWALRTQFNLSCQEKYYYQSDLSSYNFTRQMINLQLKDYCPQQKTFNPFFIRKDSTQAAVMEKLKQADVTAFERGEDLRTEIPDGAVNFHNSSMNQLSTTLSINDFRLPEYHKNNGATKILIRASKTAVIGTYLRVTEGLMSLVDKVTRPYLQKITQEDKQILAGSYMYMPFSGSDTSLIDKAVNVIGSGLYPLGLSLLMPILLYMVVSEKEERQIQIMKMNGLDSKHYWINYFIVSFLLSMLTSFLMYLFGAYIIDITFFQQTSLMLIWITYVGWAIAQIALTSFVQIFISNSKTATIVGYLLSIFSTIIGQVISTLIFPLPMRMPFGLLLYPPFALCRIIYYMGWACSQTTGCYRSLVGMQPQMFECIVILYMWFFVYLLSIWLNQMVQQQYGVAKNPYLIQKCLNLCRNSGQQKSEMLIEQSQQTYTGKPQDANEIQLSDMQNQQLNRKEDLVDESVLRHREEVISGRIDQALVIRDISKKYQIDNGEKDKVALKPLTMKLIKGQILGFLGPNGAGKTTLISVLTGMYPQTSGKAWIGGRQIGNASTNMLIGVCPQFDILWGQLTVEEHLRFYCKLKQVNDDEIDVRVEELLKEVDLIKQRNYFIGQLSGGMQRRVSIACALSGDPSVVILDEPTSGLDPYHRRQIWKILARCKKRTSIFMTSHLMDQVQFLCDRIAIISQGQMKCIGDLNSLKQKFGKGYRLTISYPAILKSQESACPEVVEQLIRKLRLEIINQLETRVVLKIDRRDMRECIETLKKESELDWFINQPSLYDVFMHFVK